MAEDEAPGGGGVSILECSSYEDYLDQYVTEEDIFFLEDQDAARRIVELGYKVKGVLSREEFESARRLALAGPPQGKRGDDVLCSSGRTYDDDALLDALAKREELVRAGKLATIIFISDCVHGQEVSAYIDYGHRLRNEDFTEYFSAAKKLLPKRSDLSYYNWKTHVLFYNVSTNFQVLSNNEGGLLFEHTSDRKVINVDPKAVTPGENSTRTVLSCKNYLQVTLFDHVVE